VSEVNCIRNPSIGPPHEYVVNNLELVCGKLARYNPERKKALRWISRWLMDCPRNAEKCHMELANISCERSDTEPDGGLKKRKCLNARYRPKGLNGFNGLNFNAESNREMCPHCRKGLNGFVCKCLLPRMYGETAVLL
jgi:hypothetical protein